VQPDTSADQEKPQRPPLLSALPMFAATPSRRLDPALPTVETDDSPDGSPSPSTASGSLGSPSDPHALPSPSGSDASSFRPTSTSGTEPRLKPGGDPEQVRVVIAGLLLMVTATLGVLAARRGREFRQPDRGERDAIARPLARIAVRHLPLDLIGPDLADATEATVAVHNYVSAGALLVDPRVTFLGDDEDDPDNEETP
jgi:hypothetical protein